MKLYWFNGCFAIFFHRIMFCCFSSVSRKQKGKFERPLAFASRRIWAISCVQQFQSSFTPTSVVHHLPEQTARAVWRPWMTHGGIHSYWLRLSQGFPKLSLAMYPFSIWTDEHVPPKHQRRRDFFQSGTKSGFSRSGPKIFLQGGQKRQNFIFTTRN